MIVKEPNVMASCDKVLVLLPWYANGSLKAAEQQAVAEHLRSCAACQTELAEFQLLQARWQQVSTRPETEDSFARLMAKIDAADRSDSTAASRVATTRSPDGARAPAPGFGRRVSDWWHGHAGRSNNRLMTLVSVSAAMLLAIIGARAWQWAEPAVYRTLALPGREGNTEATYVRVVFAPTASVGQLVDLIESLDARIVDGPTEPGAFTVRLRSSATTEAAVQHLAERLRADPAVVFAEPAVQD